MWTLEKLKFFEYFEITRRQKFEITAIEWYCFFSRINDTFQTWCVTCEKWNFKNIERKEIEKYTFLLSRILLEYFHSRKALQFLPAKTMITVYRRPQVLFRDEFKAVTRTGSLCGSYPVDSGHVVVNALCVCLVYSIAFFVHTHAIWFLHRHNWWWYGYLPATRVARTRLFLQMGRSPLLKGQKLLQNLLSCKSASKLVDWYDSEVEIFRKR